MAVGTASSDSMSWSTMWPGATGRWLLRIRVGSVSRTRCSALAKAVGSTL
jgi:hypothetical protein